MSSQLQDPTLGELVRSDRLETVLDGALAHGGESVPFSIDPDGGPIEAALALARGFVGEAAHYLSLAEAAVCGQFLSMYNDDWREEGQPVLDAAEFSKALKLAHINFLGAAAVDVFYGDGGLLGGHSLIAQSFDGTTFDHATMYG